ncbi:GFA family protein [Acuticoccus yangtzensis]|uniref:GFA family protein n=1 Tax=Acuticoccus yangtzensis TaxID=1443441 RepID=UPI00094979C8|nr:GFA family protein [Acuticoccus yangtzensis]
MARRGRCNCGAVTFSVAAEPEAVGLCHCTTCQRETGGPFMAYMVVGLAALTVTGTTASWRETTDHRHFCPRCGTPLFATMDGDPDAEVRLGALDDASGLIPTFELWVDRRAAWLAPLPGAEQYERNRP